MRKLASVQTISRLTPIYGADAIEVADVLGWHVVVKKDEFKVGELVVYCEVDSIMPDKPEFEFLKERNFRIKTIRLRGQVSQGICFPLSILPNDNYSEDDDVTDLIGVQLYEAPEQGDGFGVVINAGGFPSHIVPKTSEDRVQTKKKLLAVNKGRECYITEKLDGTSSTFICNDSEFILASRNMSVDIHGESVYAEIAHQYNIFEKITGSNISIQGEIVGPGIRQNKYKLPKHDLFVFNVIDTKTFKYYNIEEMKEFCDKMGLRTVPILDENYILNDNIDELVELSKGNSVLHNVMREGIVVRSSGGSRFSFKSLNPDFLLKFE